MNKKSISKNYFYNLVYQLLLVILPVVTVPYISRVLGAENIGIYSYTISITTYFITFGTLGTALYGQREVAFFQNDKNKYSQVFFEIVIFRFITLIISMLFFYIFFIRITNSYSFYYKILFFEIIGNMFDISWFFQGLEEFKKTVTRNIFIKIISVFLIFILVKSQNDLPLYILIYVISVVVGNLSLWFYLPKYIQKCNLKDINIARHIKPTIGLFIPQIAIQVYTLLDKTMIGTIIPGKSEVGYYDQAQKIIKLLLTIITSLGTVMMPRIAFNYSQGKQKEIEKYIINSFKVAFLLSFPMIIGIFIVSDYFVPVFFGEGYEKVSLLMKVISPILLFIGLSNVTGTQYLLAIKKQKEFTLSVIVGAVVNFILNMLLIPKYESLGASIGTILAELSVTIIQLIYVRKDFEIFNIIKSLKKYFISGIMMAIVCLVISHLELGNLIKTCIIGIVGILVYLISLLLLKDELIISILSKIKMRKQNKFRKEKMYEI